MNYSEFQKSEFYGWFGVGETGRVQQPNGLTRINLKPGGFQEFIDLHLDITAADAIDSAALLVDRSWFISPAGINMMGIDILKSFVSAMITDASIRDPLVNTIWNLSDQLLTMETIRRNESVLDPTLFYSVIRQLPRVSMPMITISHTTYAPKLSPEILHLLITCLGIKDTSTISAPSWSLTASNVTINSHIWLNMKADLNKGRSA